jgi:serine O-acetyltransferase
MFRSFCHQNEIEGNYDPTGSDLQALTLDVKARDYAQALLQKIPDIRAKLAFDVQAAFDGDPASANTDEVILAYPGVLAITVYRYAHELYLMDVPLMPRTMSEWAHQSTGIDINPGAKIGRSFFIDHGTGVVIGETTEIGDNVKLYQGVTLGALSFLKDERGRMVRGYKRHPTVRDNVTIYANAIILGGDTVLGEGCTIGGSTFLTTSVPPGCTVTTSAPELKVRPPKGAASAPHVLDFCI